MNPIALAYQSHVSECRAALAAIEAGMKRHAEARKFHREGWGYVGDVRHLRDCLVIAEQWINQPATPAERK